MDPWQLQRKLRSLNDPSVVAALTILLVNDFYLKSEYHNWVTGKLSDFSGLFVFVLFWTALFPVWKKSVYVLTALIFIYWKSSWSQGFIDFFGVNFYTIDRIIDPTDLIALLILPIAYHIDPDRQFGFRIASVPIAALTLFSFCATSHPRPQQVFDPPVYLVVKSGTVETSFKVLSFDSLRVIQVDYVTLDKFPPLDDSFQKKQVLKDLERYSLDSSDNWLPVKGKNSMTVNVESYTDELNFVGSRQHGSYKRYSHKNQLVIEGRYKNGLEDSVWNFYEKDNNVARKFFVDGELTKIEKFENGKMISQNSVTTREDSTIKQCVIVGIVSVLLIFIVFRLIHNFRKSDRVIPFSTTEKVVLILLLPTIIYILFKIISFFISSADTDFIEIILQYILINLVMIPIFTIVLYGIKLRNRFDLILYIFLFSLLLTWLQEIKFLREIL